MGRRCSHRASNGRSSSRTCTEDDYSCCTGLRLFGVKLEAADSSDADMTKKCFDVSSSAARFPSSSNWPTSSSLLSIGKAADMDAVAGGYLSDGLVARAQERKKGVPWTEEEHRAFLAGLERLGKGDWRGISRHFVNSRTPTQVASHAQKFFLRQTGPSEKKRRSSLFDAVGGGGGGASVPRPHGKDATIPCDSHASAASSLRKTGRGRAAIDLNGSGEEEDSTGQTTPPCPTTSPAPCTPHELDDRLPSGPASPSQRVGTTMPPQPAALRLPSLELTIASPVAEQRSSPPGSFFAKGVVAVT